MAEQKVLANKDAEQSILGAVFYDESTIRLLKDKVVKEDFYFLRHQEIFECMVELFDHKTPIDSTTVISSLDDKGKLNECGGSEYILGLMDAVPSISNIETYIELVKDKAVQRKVIKACNDIIIESNKDIEDSKTFLDGVEKKIYEATKERTAKDLTQVASILEDSYQKIKDNASRDGDVTGIDTGYRELNRLTLGFQKSELIILAARPSMGKTAFALNLACNVASLKTRPYVAFFSMEMSLDQLALRLISAKSNIDQSTLKTGKFYEKDAWSRIRYAIDELKDYNLLFDESGVSTVQQLRSLCRKKKSEGKLDMVVIDYLQLLSSSSKNDSRVQEVSEISRSLKEMAKELDIPVIALSQLSRTLEARQDKRPIMSDLRESGSIEQDADIVMFIYRDAYYNKESEKKNIAEILIQKNRNGIVGSFELIFKGECTNFIDMAQEGTEE